KRIELDKAVALLLVIADDFCARGDLIARSARRQELDAAADMNPWAQNGIVDQHVVHHLLQETGMAEPLAQIDRIGLPDIGEILFRRLTGPSARGGAEPFAELVSSRVHRLALRDRSNLVVIGELKRRRRGR